MANGQSSKSSGTGGIINTKTIYDTHRAVKTLVETYGDINKRVAETTKKVKTNWIGKGANEFEVQYEDLISKIEDFGDILNEIYDSLVNAEFSYEEADETLHREYNLSMQ